MSDSKERVGGVCRTCRRTNLEHAGGKCPQPESADDVLRDMMKALPVLRNVLNTAGLAGADVAEQLHARAQAAVGPTFGEVRYGIAACAAAIRALPLDRGAREA